MKYYSEAEDSLVGWENQSLPIGNGYFGASVFGGAKKERIQFTTNEFANIYSLGGVTSFADLYIESDCGDAINYERGLNLNDGTAYSFFDCRSAHIECTAFCNYPDNVFVYKIKSTAKTNFTARLVVPYLGAREEKDGGRTGKVYAEGNSLVLRQFLPLRDCIGELRLRVLGDGKVTVSNEFVTVNGANEAVFLVVLGTNYKLCPEVFEEGCNKALGEDPDKKLKESEERAVNAGFDKLYANHVRDYGELMGRAAVDLGGKADNRSVDELLSSFRLGNEEPYLIELYFQYGRHLLVSSSRKGTPPASLQGTWSAHDKSPWGSGIWHNINVQMNYWCALNTNIAETFSAYADYWKAYLPKAEKNAREWVSHFVPRKSGEKCGWIIGTAAFMYEISGLGVALHSGPGTGGLTAKMFADYYDYTKDDVFLRNYAYPAVHGCAEFMEKSVKKYGDEYLCMVSASPEQILSGVWIKEYRQQQYYATIGCAFDQQMLYENAKDDLRFSKILGVKDDVTKRESSRISRLSAINVGYSGQIKEYEEEKFYGEIGAARHRHVSQLVALMPGRTINEKTPAWLDSAKKTLELRGDDSTGWALAHRMLLWARAREGERAYGILSKLLKEKTNHNLWDEHPPFQIDGNFGATAGIAEMLLQSGDGCISLFPAIPSEWKGVSFEGLRARGNFIVSAKRVNGIIKECRIESRSGGKVSVEAVGVKTANVTEANTGEKIRAKYGDGKITFNTIKGGVYKVCVFSSDRKHAPISRLTATFTSGGVMLKWKGKGRYAVYRAALNDKKYTLLGVCEKGEFLDKDFDINNKIRLTYKVVSANGEYSQNTRGAVAFLSPATELETDRYKLRLKVNNMYADEWELR